MGDLEKAKRHNIKAGWWNGAMWICLPLVWLFALAAPLWAIWIPVVAWFITAIMQEYHLRAVDAALAAAGGE